MIGWLTAVVAVACCIGPVRGQAMPGVPDPITTAELREYGDLLGLSDAQRLALEPHHDAYRQRFRELRDTDIYRLQDQVLGFMDEMRMNQFRIPARSDLEDALDKYFGLSSKVERVDNSLFAAMDSILTEEQRQRMPRVRATRALEVYGMIAHEMIGEINNGAAPHLTRMVMDLDVPAEAMEAADPELASYERGLLKEMKSARSTMRETATMILDAIDRFGLRNMSLMEIGEFMQDEKNLEEFKALFTVASAPIQQVAYEFSQFNRRSLGRIVAVLPEAKGRELQERYNRRVYREAYSDVSEWRAPYLEVLRLPGLGSGVESAVRAQLQSFTVRDDAMVNKIGDMLEEYRKFRSVDQLEAEGKDAFAEKLEEEVEKRIALATLANQTLEGLLDAETRSNLSAMRMMEEGDSNRVQMAGGEGDGEVVEFTAGTEGSSVTVRSFGQLGGLLLPEPINRQDFTALLNEVAIPADDRIILDAVYSDYATEYDATAQELTAAKDAENEEDSAAVRIRAFAAKRDAAIERLAAAEAMLYDNVAPWVPASKAEVFAAERSLRERAFHVAFIRRQAQTWGMMQMDEESFIELDALDAITQLEATQRATIAPMLADYATERLTMLRQLSEAARAQRLEFEIFTAAMQREEWRGSDMSKAMQSRWQAKQQVMKQAATTAADLNRAKLEQIKAKMDPYAASDLAYAYNMRAYPDLYADAKALNERFTEALGLTDLAPHQRQRVMEISGEFRERFDELTRKMVTMRRERSGETFAMEMPSRKFFEREITMERTKFDREEVVSRARERLRLILTDEQRAQVLAAGDATD
ncbi:MAG: hypothetical protein KC983_00835 [Phycisphaerales bacterium]|nr:hypothetical protein [Phycisphaerales bacterium]